MLSAVRAILLTLLFGSLMLANSDHLAAESTNARASTFELKNGLQVVVIPDHRSPVVTHMIWYKVGAADERPGVSGIAHFLEHLMFKSTEKIAVGEFSKIVSRMGGQDNAFTGQDVTAYFQRVAKDRLEKMMELEADRMVNLRLDEKEVATERNVILEERRSRIDNSPTALLDEQMNAALFQNHSYGTPVIGWYHEIATLSRENAFEFYNKYYAPNNAILVVSGDVTEAEVRRLAEKTYGKVKPSETLPDKRTRRVEPPQIAARRVELKDARAGNYSLHRYYVVPSYVTADPGEAEALDLMMKIATTGPTSRLYREVVVEQKLATSASGNYSGTNLDDGTLSLYAVAADGVPLEKLEAAVEGVLNNIIKNGVTASELERAKKNYVSEYVYASDNQATLARRYGWNIAIGKTIEDIETWPKSITAVTQHDIKRVAAKYLDLRRSVTGYLIPDKTPVADAQKVKKPAAAEPSVTR